MTSPEGGPPPDRFPVRARDLLRQRAVWVLPMVLASVVIAAMTALYLGSAVDPVAHVRDLPVEVVNGDRGVTLGTQRVEIGRQIEAGLRGSPEVSHRLRLESVTLPAAEDVMNHGRAYATIVIPPDFTASLLAKAGLPTTGTPGDGAIRLLTNPRAGTLGVSLATGILQPAMAAASRAVSGQLTAAAAASSPDAATTAFLASPVTLTTSQFHPPPASSALGLSAFYLALLTLMCGFLTGTILHGTVDAALGYGVSEVGPRWTQLQPKAIRRWRTLLIKWAMAAVLTAVATGLMITIAAGALGMDAPQPLLLWLYAWLCAASVAAGTIVLFAVLGTPGQLVALLLFVYAGLASAGGTVPIEALPGFFRVLSEAEPLRQILAGDRAILHFDAQADAGLARGFAAAAIGLLLWLVAGTVIVRWYDRRALHRMAPDLLAHVDRAVQDYRAGTRAENDAAAASSPADVRQGRDPGRLGT
jgi:YhgE/Pip-like protein